MGQLLESSFYLSKYDYILSVCIHILYMYVGSPDTIVLSISEDSGGTDSLLTLMGQSAQEYLMDRIGTCSH